MPRQKESLWMDVRGCFEGSTHEVETAVDV
jgi:hypothetical protein